MIVYDVNNSSENLSLLPSSSLNRMKPGPKTQLREGLIASATHVLTEQGLPGLSLREVARHAGVSANAAYRHFEDRQALLAAVAGEGYRELRERFEAGLAAEGSHPLRALVRAYFEFAVSRTNMHELMTSAELQGDRRHDLQLHEGRRCFEMLCGAIRHELADDRSDAEVTREAASTWSCVYGVSTLLTRGTLGFLGEAVPTPESLTNLLLLGMHASDKPSSRDPRLVRSEEPR